MFENGIYIDELNNYSLTPFGGATTSSDRWGSIDDNDAFQFDGVDDYLLYGYDSNSNINFVETILLV